MRLDKYVSTAANISRRDAARAISAGRVSVEGAVVRNSAAHIDENAQITLDGSALSYSRYIYIMLNKPAGYITATEDARPGERVVTDLLPPELLRRGLFPVGRLDRDTTGLLLITDDGVSAHRALSPKHHVKKSYRFTCEPQLTDEMRERLEGGVDIGERNCAGDIVLTAPAEVRGDIITITEGKFHQIKRMFHAVGSEITSLSRVEFAGIGLDASLGAGEWRYLDDREIALFTGGNADTNSV